MTSQWAIECTDFSFTYPEAEFSLHTLTWKIAEGSFVLLRGKTGSGKTTLLKCLVPALAPQGQSDGVLQLFGQPPAKLSLREACSLIGYVPQNPEASIVCQTVLAELAFGLENLGVSQETMSKRIAEIAAFFAMESWINQETATLSGGQKHIVALASVLVMRPKVLLLDEPLAQLDPVAQKSFASLLFRINKELGTTIVVATHDPYTLAPYASEAVTLSSNGVIPTPLDTFALRPWTPPVKICHFEHDEAFLTREVWFRYDKSSPWILQGMETQSFVGQSIALIGGNGAGKTTYLQLVARLLKPQVGKVKNHFATCQAYLPQNPQMILVCDSVEDELREWQISAGYSDEALDKMLDLLELSNKRTLHPMDLSGGEQQKLALGKLLLTQPALLILDEPTKGLDYETKFLITHLLQQTQQRGTTILMATHDLACAAYLADHMWLLFDGRLVCDEPPHDFLRDTMLYQAYEDPFTQAIDAMRFGDK